MQGGQRGFTLIELLVTMAVLAVLGALSFRGLSSVLDAEAQVQAQSRRWSEVSLLVSQMSQDVAMAVERPVRDSGDRVSPALVLRGTAAGAADSDEGQLVITRLGRGDGGATQASPRRVGYRLRDGILEYLVWPALDSAPGTVPIAEPALGDVTELHIQALDHDGTWTSVWPAARPASALPRAVAVQIGFAGGNRVTRILPLR
jgi:general secretion pathway protein J